MSSSLPQLMGNYITHNCMYGLAVFCRKDPENIEAMEGNWQGPEGLGGEVGNGERRGVEEEGREAQENLNEEGELFAWESDLDSEDERHSARRSISVPLVEGNCMSFNGSNTDIHDFLCKPTHTVPCISNTSLSYFSAAVGLYVKSSEPLNVFANLVNNNHGTGIAVLQSSQLTRLVTNCVLENGRAGVTVERDCRVELRGNGIYENSGHGVSFSGSGQIVENDVVGNRGYGIQVTGSADIKVRGYTAAKVLGSINANLGYPDTIFFTNQTEHKYFHLSARWHRVWSWYYIRLGLSKYRMDYKAELEEESTQHPLTAAWWKAISKYWVTESTEYKNANEVLSLTKYWLKHSHYQKQIQLLERLKKLGEKWCQLAINQTWQHDVANRARFVQWTVYSALTSKHPRGGSIWMDQTLTLQLGPTYSQWHWAPTSARRRVWFYDTLF